MSAETATMATRILFEQVMRAQKAPEKTKGGIANGGTANLCGSGNREIMMFTKENEFTDSPKVPGKPACKPGWRTRQRAGQPASQPVSQTTSKIGQGSQPARQQAVQTCVASFKHANICFSFKQSFKPCKYFVQPCKHLFKPFKHIYIYIYTHTHTYICICLCMYIYIYVYIERER